MRRWSWRLSAGAALLVLIAIVAGWLLLRASLPQLDGAIDVDNLTAAVTVQRDGMGVPVLTASSRLDLAFATGFVHGQDRFFQMDLIRRQAAGELSELVGEAALDIDKRFRFHRFRARAAAVIDLLKDAERSLLDKYAEGVNAGLDSLRAKPFEYYLLGADPAPWQAQDSLLAVYTMFADLNDTRADKEVRRSWAFRTLPREVYAWMYPSGSPWDAPLMGGARAVAAIPPATVVSLRGVSDTSVPAGEAGKEPLEGSNNWAVSGALTANGRAIVANDMHLNLTVPNIYYRARLVVEGSDARDVTGVTLPGTPFVVAGSNGRVAWGYTNSYGDYSDAVVVRPGGSAGSYRTSSGDRAFSVYKEFIRMDDGSAVEYSVRETIWGPVRDDVDYPDGEIAVSWIAHKPGSVNLNMLKLETAASVEEALDVANTMGMPPQNFVAGDDRGNIGWTIAGRIPARSGFDPQLPAEWGDGIGWTGWVAAEDYPRIVNPESGRIWTANARVADGPALAIVGDGGYDLGARARQIRDGLFARDRFTPEDMLAIQYDDRALFLAPWRDLLLDLLDDKTIRGDEELIGYRELLVDWIPRAVPEAVGYRLVRAFRLEVERRLFHALTEPVRAAYGDEVRLRKSHQFEAALWSVVTERPLHMLPADYENWDAFLLSALRQSIAYYYDKYDGPLADRRWGEVNTATIRHPLSRAIPLLGRYLDMPADELNGDHDMPKAQAPAFGASERFAVSPGDEANGIMHMPAGQSGHPLSAFYSLGHDDWVKGRAAPYLPGVIVHTLTLTPKRR